jgi:hypothetical protein
LHPESLAHSLAVLRRVVDVVERDAVYRSRNPKGEPQVGRRGLYAAMGGQRAASYDQMALLWVLNLADGRHSLLDMADRAAVPFATVRAAADALVFAELLEPISALEMLRGSWKSIDDDDGFPGLPSRPAVSAILLSKFRHAVNSGTVRV